MAEIGTSVIVLAEIRRGIELKRRTDPEQAASLDRWFAQMRSRLGDRLLPIDETIADTWARLNVPDPLPLIDGLLPATAKVYGLTLVTRNIADISRTGCHCLTRFPHKEAMAYGMTSDIAMVKKGQQLFLRHPAQGRS